MSVHAPPHAAQRGDPGHASLWAALWLLLALLIQGSALAQEETGTDEGVPDQIAADLPATDTQACLSCHRFPGMSTLDADSGEARLFFVSERYYLDREGPHSRVECVGCHSGDAVEQVPHGEVTPVDCSQACHLESSTGAPVRFSHDHIADRVDQSVHGGTAMQDLPWTEPPLRQGQSSCLFCHDQPVFALIDHTNPDHQHLDDGARCDVCHDAGLAVDVDYALQHTVSRLDSARPVEQQAEACAVCHSNERFVEAMESHDVVSSYVLSFHGKASLLGSEETATCLDCHESEAGDAHGMRSHDDPEATTNADQLELTCRSAQCHPNAAPEISGAAVHLEIDPEVRSWEYGLIVAFLVLIGFELSQYFVLALLELINLVVRRESVEELRREAMVHEIRKSRLGRRLLSRMGVAERIQHWLLVVTFTLLVITGMPLRFAAHPASQWVADLMGGIASIRVLHRIAGVGLFIVFGVHLLLLGIRGVRLFRRIRSEQPELGPLGSLKQTLLAFPMVPTLTDVKQFGQMYGYLMGLRKERPHRGKFHFSQKIEYWAVFWGMGIIGISGVLMWGANWVPDWLGGRALNFAIIVHSYEAFLAMMYIVIAHIYAVIFAPSVFPMSLGAMTGQSPAKELVENHLGHVEDVAERVGIDPSRVEIEHPSRAREWGMRFYALLIFAPVAILGVWSAKYLVDQSMGRTRSVDVASLPLKLEAETLASTSGGRSEGLRRGPLSHFHQIPTWYSQDVGNTCNGSGCHAALPHGERKENRAYLNMHSTFVDCQTCHLDQPIASEDLLWTTLDEQRQRRDPPAVLRLAAALDMILADEGSDEVRQQHDQLVGLLQQAVEESDGDPELSRWLLELRTTRVGGPMYVMHIDEMRQKIYMHGHGEYGAKVGLPGTDTRRWVLQGDMVAAADALRVDDGSLPEAQREELVDTVHQGLSRPEPRCTRCHSEDPDLVDFSELGFSAGRAQALRSLSIVRQSEAVERGEVLYLPLLFQQEADARTRTEGQEPW